MAKNCCLIILSLFTCLFTLAAFGLNLYHYAAHASYEDKKTGIVLRDTQNVENYDDCPWGLQIKKESKNPLTGDDVVYVYTCPWGKGTKLLGMISFLLCQVFAITICCKAKGKGSVACLGITSAIVLLLVMITIILYIIDIVKGHKRYTEMETDETSYQPLTYILNILFAAFGLLFGIICAAMGCRSTLNIPRASAHQPTQNPNNSTFVGINKTIGMEQSFQLTGQTYGNDNSYAATQTWNNGYYTGNTQNYHMNGQSNRVQGGGNLVYQTNNMQQAQNMGYNSNHRGHVNLTQNNGRRAEQGYAGNVVDGGRRNRMNRRENPVPVQNNGYANNNYANNYNNYRGNNQVRNYQG